MKLKLPIKVSISIILLPLLSGCGGFVRFYDNDRWWKSFENEQVRIEKKTTSVYNNWVGYTSSTSKHYRAQNKTAGYLCLKADIGYTYRVHHNFPDKWIRLKPHKDTEIGKTVFKGSAIDNYEFELSWRVLPANKKNKCKWSLDELIK